MIYHIAYEPSKRYPSVTLCKVRVVHLPKGNTWRTIHELEIVPMGGYKICPICEQHPEYVLHMLASYVLEE